MSKSMRKKKFAGCRLKTVDFFCILLTAICLLAFTTEINPTIRYVSPTGNNIPPYLTWEDAANSIQDAINVCEPGDTVLVDNGTYYENLVINTSISLIGLSMDSTLIDGRGLGDFTILNNEPLSIQNFNIIGKGENTVGTRCIQFYNFLEIRNCKIIETELGLGSVGSDIVAESVLMDKIKGGFSLFGNSNNYISKCIVLLNQQNSIGIGVGFAPNGTYHITNNIILFTGGAHTFDTGISIDKPRKVFINNNLISGFKGGIDISINIDSAIIKNNVLVNGGVGISSINDDVITNNNILKKNLTGIAGAPVQSDYNLFWENIYNYYYSNYGDSDIVADPMFVKDTLPNPDIDFDYHLQAYSPAIDAGDPDILDVDGSRSDMGLFGGPLGESYTYQDLAPKPPSNLTAVYLSNAIHLNWNKNTEADFSHYRIYRDTVPNFIYDISKMIGETEDTTFVDVLPEPNIARNYYYKLTAFDNQGNQSAASEEVLVIVTGLGEIPPKIVDEYKLLNNYPNPFNPSTTIPYRLKEAGYVKVMVYNILGQLVRVLVNQWQEKGYYEVEFRPDELERIKGEEGFPGMHTWQHSNYVSGVYLLRIEVIGEGKIPKFTDMRKMMLVK